MSILINTKEELENFILKNWDEVNNYIEAKKSDLPIPFYSSVDVRESKTKYAPVDHNMFPAGFNNLCSADFKEASKVAGETLKKLSPNAKMIGIFPESHTKNLMYLDHLATLGKIIEDAGYQVRLLSFDHTLFPEGADCLGLTSNSGAEVIICKALVKDGEVYRNADKMDMIICNNDQSNPWPIDWAEVKTVISPTPKIGWFRRQKNIHFGYYNKVANDFCAHFKINPDLIQAKFKAVEDVDFENKSGLEKLGTAVDELISELKPGSKVFVKASQGTYGMGISVVASGEEIINMNRKTRNKMDVGKNSIKFTSLPVQEGVETIIKYDDMPAEITIYLIDGRSIGGFMRVNGEKDDLGNLNSRGMVFRKLCMGDVVDSAEDHTTKEAMYSVIARLATIASAYEIKEVL